jgi:hypothetical protein
VRTITGQKWQSRIKHDLIIEVWEALDCESVGAPELEQIQHVVGAKFGAGAVESPAAIARVVADEGAQLRHPEVLDFDSEWRAANMARLMPLEELDFKSLAKAADAMRKLEAWRRELGNEDHEVQLRLAREQALELKRQAQLLARSSIVEQPEREMATEIAQWLAVWLSGPDLFLDWLGLRLQAPGFIKKFGVVSTE